MTASLFFALSYFPSSTNIELPKGLIKIMFVLSYRGAKSKEEMHFLDKIVVMITCSILSCS